MTIGLVGELLKQRYGEDWFELVKSEYRQLFPKLPDKTLHSASGTTWNVSTLILPCAFLTRSYLQRGALDQNLGG